MNNSKLKTTLMAIPLVLSLTTLVGCGGSGGGGSDSSPSRTDINIAPIDYDPDLKLVEISEDSGLELPFGWWGSWYWNLESRGKPESNLRTFTDSAQNIGDDHLISVGSGGDNLHPTLDGKIFRMSAKLDLIASVNESGRFTTMLGLESLFFEKHPSKGGSRLRSWDALWNDGNVALELLGMDTIPAPANDAGSDVKTRAGIRAMVTALSAAMVDHTDLITIISLNDEPYLGFGVDRAVMRVQAMYNAQTMILEELANSGLSNAKTYVNFVSAVVVSSRLPDIIPPLYDYVSFNCYKKCEFDRPQNPDYGVKQLTDRLIANKAPHQKVIMIPYGGAQLPVAQSNDLENNPNVLIHAAWVNNVAIQYFNYAATSTEIVGILPFFHTDVLTHWSGAYRFDNQMQTFGKMSTKISEFINR